MNKYELFEQYIKDYNVNEETTELSEHDKIIGLTRCLHEMTEILKGAIRRHETERNID